MGIRRLLGLFHSADQVVNATEQLKNDGFSAKDFDVYSGSPYPEGSFGEHVAGHRLYAFPIIGAICGFAVAILVASRRANHA